MTIKQYVEISEDVEIDLDVDEIFNNLSSSEKDELLEILLEDRSRYNKGYYIENLMLGKCDKDILNNKKIWDKLIKFIKYDEPTLKDYIIEELLYEPNKITK